jgi:hypothetical protein
MQHCSVWRSLVRAHSTACITLRYLPIGYSAFVLEFIMTKVTCALVCVLTACDHNTSDPEWLALH